MPGPRRPRPYPEEVLRSWAVAGAAALLVAGCGRTVAVQPLPQSPASTAECGGLVDALPQVLPTGRRWTVAPDPATTAAWGSPAVVLRCGAAVPQPSPTDQLLTIDGVDWWVVPLSAGDRFTTVARTPAVEVLVPAQAGPGAQVVAALNPAVAQHSAPAP